MDQPPSPHRALWAYVGPFALFAVLLQLPALVRWLEGTPPVIEPEWWVYPLQTLFCGAMLAFFWREYPRALGWKGALWGMIVGTVVFVLWISPQAFFHAEPRIKDGFDPSGILRLGAPSAGLSLIYAATVVLRFVRLVVVVPLVEELFWRGFLLRFLIREDFLSLRFGSWSRWSFGVVTVGFMLEHRMADWPAALATGILYNLVAIRARRLSACVLAHALTNALLGVYVMRTHQWGFW